MKQRITINTEEYGFMPWPQRVAHLRTFGFEALEISGLSRLSADEFAALQRLLRDERIQAVAGHEWYHFFAPGDSAGIRAVTQRMLLNIQRTCELGADRLVWYTGENALGRDPAAVSALLCRLEPALRRAEQLGVTLLLETEFSERGQDLAGSVSLLKSVMTQANSKYLRINFDPANLYVAGVEPYPYAYDQLKPWIGYVHLKDVCLYDPAIHIPYYMKGCGRDGYCVPLGEGGTNAHGLLSALRADDYSGWISFELHVPEQRRDEVLRKGLAFLERLGYAG